MKCLFKLSFSFFLHLECDFEVHLSNISTTLNFHYFLFFWFFFSINNDFQWVNVFNQIIFIWLGKKLPCVIFEWGVKWILSFVKLSQIFTITFQSLQSFSTTFSHLNPIQISLKPQKPSITSSTHSQILKKIIFLSLLIKNESLTFSFPGLRSRWWMDIAD